MSVSSKCAECGASIATAKCCEGWCTYCHYAVSDFVTLRLYCRAHRTHVERDAHCSAWTTDAQS